MSYLSSEIWCQSFNFVGLTLRKLGHKFSGINMQIPLKLLSSINRKMLFTFFPVSRFSKIKFFKSINLSSTLFLSYIKEYALQLNHHVEDVLYKNCCRYTERKYMIHFFLEESSTMVKRIIFSKSRSLFEVFVSLKDKIRIRQTWR